MLKLFHYPTETTKISLWTEDQPEETDSDMLEDTVVAQECGQPTFGPQLLEGQYNQLQELLEELSDVLQAKPGRTSLVEHYIDSGNSNPLR